MATQQLARSCRAGGASRLVASSSSSAPSSSSSSFLPLHYKSGNFRALSTTRACNNDRTPGQQIASVLGSASSSVEQSSDPAKAHLSAIEALRKAISRNQDRASRGGQQDSSRSRSSQGRNRRFDGTGLESREGGVQGNRRGGNRGGAMTRGRGQRGGQRGQDGNRRQRQRSTALDSIRNSSQFLAEENATMESDVRPKTDWSMAPQASITFTKVPYAAPGTSMETLNPNLDKRAQHPYENTAPLLKFETYPVSSNTTVRGQLADTVPFARPGRSESNRVTLKSAEESNSSSETSTSIAAAAQEVRRQTIREDVGGDYVRWTPQAILDNSKHSTPLDKQVARALALNDDLGPSLKHWTMSEVQSLLVRTGATKSGSGGGSGAAQQRAGQ